VISQCHVTAEGDKKQRLFLNDEEYYLNNDKGFK
jgi:hypothetical protein